MRSVRVYGPELRFAAAHFATYAGQCEPLHGHNYALTVEVHGELTQDSWLLDFGELRRTAAEVCQLLDHTFLLPTESRHLSVQRSEGHYRIAFADRRYVMPEAEVSALPIDNSTAERLTEWIAGRLAGALKAAGAANLASLAVTVEEGPGQSASFALDLAGGS